MEILLNLGSDASHEQGRFSKTLSEESFKFISSRRNGIIASKLSFVLLLAEINLVLEKQGRKGYAFVIRTSDHVEIIFTLSTKVIGLYEQTFIVKVKITGLKKAIAECGICLKLAMFLAFNK